MYVYFVIIFTCQNFQMWYFIVLLFSCSVISDSLRPHGLVAYQAPLSMGFPGNSPGVDCHFLLLGIFPTQGSNPGLPHCRPTLYRLSHQGSSLEGMMQKLKLQYFGHLMRRVDSLEKTDAGRDWGQEEKGTTEDEMAG